MTDKNPGKAAAAADEKPAPAPVMTKPAKKRLDPVKIVDRWFLDTIHSSPVSRVTEAYNHVHKATQELKRRLSANEQE